MNLTRKKSEYRMIEGQTEIKISTSKNKQQKNTDRNDRFSSVCHRVADLMCFPVD